MTQQDLQIQIEALESLKNALTNIIESLAEVDRAFATSAGYLTDTGLPDEILSNYQNRYMSVVSGGVKSLCNTIGECDISYIDSLIRDLHEVIERI